MYLPPEAVLIYENRRNCPPFYEMFPGEVLIFEFQVPVNGVLNITLVHTRPDAQDFSIQCYFSNMPLGLPIFQSYDELYSFNLARQGYPITLRDAPINPNFTSLPSGQLFYLMVTNRQNANNSVKVDFS